MPSEKTPIIEYLFNLNWDESAQSLRKKLMTLSDVQDAIRHFREHHSSTLSDRNPANFMKDIVRGQNASNVWPATLTAKRYTAIQATGDGNVFEFIPFVEDQTEPFPDKYSPRAGLKTHAGSSVSVPLFARDLGREDEPWLIQTAVNLGIIETHFGVYSPLNVIQLTHLQMSVKLRATEIDALFLAIVRDDENEIRILITCEAKQARERILEQQIIEQITAAFDTLGEIESIVPVGLRAVRGKGFYLVEFARVFRDSFDRTKSLIAENEVLYELKPALKGI